MASACRRSAGAARPCTIASISRTVRHTENVEMVREMEEMVHGRAEPADRRHAAAMVERRRRDFHREFATFRFRPLAEHGTWEGRAGIVPVG